MLEIKPQGAEKYLPGVVAKGARKLPRSMLPKKYRLADRQMFGEILSKGGRINGNFFLLTSLHTAGTEWPRVGVIISKKISKKAVVRNRIKRVVYDSVRKFLEEVSKENTLVFLAKKPVAEATSEEVSSDIDSIMIRFTKQ